jgi:hypothetical protein
LNSSRVKCMGCTAPARTELERARCSGSTIQVLPVTWGKRKPISKVGRRHLAGCGIYVEKGEAWTMRD